LILLFENFWIFIGNYWKFSIDFLGELIEEIGNFAVVPFCTNSIFESIKISEGFETWIKIQFFTVFRFSMFL
jgi:hypothetical protein